MSEPTTEQLMALDDAVSALIEAGMDGDAIVERVETVVEESDEEPRAK